MSKYKNDKEFLPKSSISSDRKIVRDKKRKLEKFGKKRIDIYWWKSLSTDDQWSVYIDSFWISKHIYCNEEALLSIKDTTVRSIEIEKKFEGKMKLKYGGQIEIKRDLKIDEIFR